VIVRPSTQLVIDAIRRALIGGLLAHIITTTLWVVARIARGDESLDLAVPLRITFWIVFSAYLAILYAIIGAVSLILIWTGPLRRRSPATSLVSAASVVLLFWTAFGVVQLLVRGDVNLPTLNDTVLYLVVAPSVLAAVAVGLPVKSHSQPAD
jgi:hypothetical protein